MARSLLLTASIFVGADAHFAIRDGRAFLGSNMQPEVVARTLKNVEEEWKAQAAVFAECSANAAAEDGSSIVKCEDAPTTFEKSCSVVVGAVVQGSNGDKRVAKEYMADVCSQKVITGWHQQHCIGLGSALGHAMSADAYLNRNSFDSKKLCMNFWENFLKEEEKRTAEEKKDHEVAVQKDEESEKAAREMAEKKAVDVAAQEARKELEERKAEVERKKVEQAALAKEKAAAAAEAAAELLAKKKAEAEAVAKTAHRKMAEAEEAEKEHQRAVAKLTDKMDASVAANKTAVVVNKTAAVVKSPSLNQTAAVRK